MKPYWTCEAWHCRARVKWEVQLRPSSTNRRADVQPGGVYPLGEFCEKHAISMVANVEDRVLRPVEVAR